MPIDSAFWRHLESRFRELLNTPESEQLTVTYGGGECTLHDGPGEERKRASLQERFRSVARNAGIAAGAPNRANAFEWWLTLLRKESPYFQAIYNAHKEEEKDIRNKGGWIRNVILASAEYCNVLAERALELDRAVAEGASAGLRRDRYPFCSWLDDHSHEPMPNIEAELEDCKARVWRGYRRLIKKYQLMKIDPPDRGEKLNSATAGLSYDVVVLQANYVIDRGLHGDEAMRIFQNESAELLKKVTSSWRASGKRLGVAFDRAEELEYLAHPFRRVSDDLRRLVAEPQTESALVAEPQTTQPAKSYKTNLGRNVDRLRRECGWSFDELAAKTGLDKKLILGHVNGGKSAHLKTVKTYALAFEKKLNRPVTVAELEG
jgi:hypothetical protein